ncbi:srg family chemoreceptor domain-containing protein [Ditylenchus destructor]|uniref:Serpentine receptor class gamma n=1 Tax=Ditylenchus destructor TaxID=166010 RepID=A0AAD4N500_9BILA|nr:srg family chemoreceptor domain-containing protein [Ditylenchus destructor]
MSAYNSLLPFFFAIAIGVPSALLYVAESYTIIVNHKRISSSPFFHLFVLRTIPSLLSVICAYVGGHRFGRAGWFLQFYQNCPQFLILFCFFIGYWSFHAENIASTSMLLNRLSSICIPVIHDKIWRRYLVPLSILATFVIPTIICHRIFWLKVFIRVQADNFTFTLDTVGRDTSDSNGGNYYACVSAIVFLFICTFLNVATVIAYRYHRKKIGGSFAQDSDSDRVKIKLTMYAVATFLGQLLMCCYYILIYYCIVVGESSELVFLTTFNQWAWINDLSTLTIPAWMLLWASTHIRTLMAVTFLRNGPVERIWRIRSDGNISKRGSDSRARSIYSNSIDVRVNQSVGYRKSLPFVKVYSG